MTSIGIIGASSQVGASVALFLKQQQGVSVTCYVRSSYSQVFFELQGIDCRPIDLRDEAGLREMLGSTDIILDFGYPAGQLHEILDRSKENIGKVLRVMKKGSAYFYMSSIMAYGMPENEKWIRHCRIPRTSYAYIKRNIERFTAREGKKQGIRIYNFRLGQVHGFLQSVNGSFRKKLSDSVIAKIDGRPDDPANIIFIHPLCEAILECAAGKHPPGLYTLVASPQWTLKELYDYYVRYYQLPVHLAFCPAVAKEKKKSFLQLGMDLAKPYRSLLETYILMRFPSLAVRLKGGFRQSQLSLQQGSSLEGLEYIDFNLLGTPPFRMIAGLTTAPEKVFAIEKEREEDYNALIKAGRQ